MANLRCPSWLNSNAKRAWKFVLPILEEKGLLESIDEQALSAYCQAFARWREAEEFLNEKGSAYPVYDEHGKVKYVGQFPQVAIARNLLEVLNKYHREFGMTPLARKKFKDAVPIEPNEADVRLKLFNIA